MNKSIRKRFKITKTGKLLHRQAGNNHFNAKESRTTQGRKKGLVSLSAGYEKNIRDYMNR